jgi:hypothetical protein
MQQNHLTIVLKPFYTQQSGNDNNLFKMTVIVNNGFQITTIL